jgi:DNA-binding protein HU-beta
MKKQDLIEALVKKTSLSKKQAGEYLNTVFDEIVKSLSQGEEVILPGFGKFIVVQRKERPGFNPKTREKITILAAKVPKFKAGKALKDLVK